LQDDIGILYFSTDGCINKSLTYLLTITPVVTGVANVLQCQKMSHIKLLTISRERNPPIASYTLGQE